MRAVLMGERLLSKCNNNARSFSKNNSNNPTNETTTLNQTLPPARKKRLIERLGNYIKSWGGQFKPDQPITDGEFYNELQQKQRVPKITTITNMRSHSTKTDTKSLNTDMPKASFAGFATPKLKTISSEGIPAEIMKSRKDLLSVQLPKVTQKPEKVIKLNKAKNGQTKTSTAAEPQVPKNLLTYPVLPLEETLNRYLISIQPFFGKKAFLREQKETLDFLRNQGAELQNLLEDAGKHEVNWLTDRWTHATYLRHRAPVTVFSSPCIAFPTKHFRDSFDFLDFTAKAIYGICDFKKLVETDQIPVYSMDGYALDNSQFHNVFGTVRIPQRCCDVLQQCCSNYVIVIHKNNFFKLTVYTEEGCLLNVEKLRNHLSKIVESECCKGPDIGLLTHDTRDNWAEAHEILCLKDINSDSIQCIQQALFTVSLDESVEVPKGQEYSTMALQLLHGGGLHVNSANRWMDKTLQLIVNPNGMAGFCCEHAPADLQPAAMIMDYVQKNISNPDYGSDCCSTEICKPPEKLKPLKFAEINDCVDLWLAAAKRNIDKICRRLEMHAFKFPCYGKCLIKSQGLTPDSYIQMALQLAFYRLHKQLPAQYESAHLRIFKCGRTEVIRSTSNTSRAFVRSMVTNISTPKRRLLALRAAVDYHLEQTKTVLQGRGVDRHLFGLRQIAQEYAKPLPDFFYSQGYLRSTNFQVVSSQVSTPHDAFMAYGPPTSEGYGCCYNPRENDIIFTISSWKLKPKINASRYAKAIELALADMGQLLLETGGPDTAKDACDCMQDKD